MPQNASNAKKNLKEKGFNFLLFIIFLFAIDRASKIYFREKLLPGESLKVLGNWLRFTLVRNKGAAFGFFQNKVLLLVILSLAVLSFFLYTFMHLSTESNLLKLSFSLIIGGAIGNLYDRISYGYVVDFIDVDIPDIIPKYPRWPVFNLADSFITIGVFLMIIYLIFTKEKNASDNI